jgi:hypothetical protein
MTSLLNNDLRNILPVATVLVSVVIIRNWGRKKHPLPPSPKGLPLIGHLHLM